MSDIDHGWEDEEPKEIIMNPKMIERYKEYPEKVRDNYPRRQHGCLIRLIIFLFFLTLIIFLLIKF